MKQCLSIPICSWMDPPHVCQLVQIPFRDHRNLFRWPLTISLVPDIFLRRRWSRASPRCEELAHDFESPEFLTVCECRRPSPPTRTLLPALTSLSFNGVSDYLEARVDAPLLDKLHVLLVHRPKFDTSQLAQFICRTPVTMTHDEAQVVFFYSSVYVSLPWALDKRVELGVSGEELIWQLLSVA
jgi:hypothetical protein